MLACDEVGRGALAGPVAVGMVVIDASVKRMPAGLRDSKLLPEPKRELLAPRASAWVLASAVGEATAEEIDRHGIMACLGMAGARAFAALGIDSGLVSGAPLLLDGNHDWLSARIEHRARVITRIKADRDCASVSAASVIAKVHRDRAMRRAHEATPSTTGTRTRATPAAPTSPRSPSTARATCIGAPGCTTAPPNRRRRCSTSK
ncbi:hypothetical protein GCM10025870_32450 [Agromyces marinus]|uniref:Ribonuclease n=1 Tax=Agromyces marinus TaxID=1389020 RepID=A0ABM8H5T9_9MICO|nr:hypothetical protein GCM10025870_32450 [Agromyces marinus]